MTPDRQYEMNPYPRDPDPWRDLPAHEGRISAIEGRLGARDSRIIDLERSMAATRETVASNTEKINGAVTGLKDTTDRVKLLEGIAKDAAIVAERNDGKLTLIAHETERQGELLDRQAAIMEKLTGERFEQSGVRKWLGTVRDWGVFLVGVAAVVASIIVARGGP